MTVTDEDVETACAAYWQDWPRMKGWPKTGPGIQASMRRALEAVMAARGGAGEVKVKALVWSPRNDQPQYDVSADCDYGDTEAADEKRKRCAETTEWDGC